MLCCDEFIVRGVFWLVGIAPPVVVIYPLPAQRQSSDLMGVVVPRVWGSGTVLNLVCNLDSTIGSLYFYRAGGGYVMVAGGLEGSRG